MWLSVGEIVTSSGGGDNLYTVLAALAGVLSGAGGLLRFRSHRRQAPDDQDPEPVAQRVVSVVSDAPLVRELRRQNRALEQKCTEQERQMHLERVRTEEFIQKLATCNAVRDGLASEVVQLRKQLVERQLKDRGAGDERRPRPE